MQIRDVRLSPKSGHHLQLRGSPEDRHTAMLLWRLRHHDPPRQLLRPLAGRGDDGLLLWMKTYKEGVPVEERAAIAEAARSQAQIGTGGKVDSRWL